jgi:1-acyl-sn-glycerol-3-phosphate acyltransferase
VDLMGGTDPRPIPPVMVGAAAVVVPAMLLAIGRRWTGGHHVPRTGGLVVASNHVSNLDPVLVGEFLLAHGAPPRNLAKAELFGNPVVGGLLRAAGQVAVDRDSTAAAHALDDAREALRDGGCVVVFPEGTFTRDPGLWPMTARTGAVRLALEEGVPLLPVVTWGGQKVMPPFTSKFRPLPRTRADVVAGLPMGRDELLGSDSSGASGAGSPVDPADLVRATDRLMDRLTAMLAAVRGERPPARRWDTRIDGDPNPRP